MNEPKFLNWMINVFFSNQIKCEMNKNQSWETMFFLRHIASRAALGLASGDGDQLSAMRFAR